VGLHSQNQVTEIHFHNATKATHLHTYTHGIGNQWKELYNLKNTELKANQNEALLWKIEIVGIKKAPYWSWNILSLTHAGLFYIPPFRICQRRA
jgi:hypothetical protein